MFRILAASLLSLFGLASCDAHGGISGRLQRALERAVLVGLRVGVGGVCSESIHVKAMYSTVVPAYCTFDQPILIFCLLLD